MFDDYRQKSKAEVWPNNVCVEWDKKVLRSYVTLSKVKRLYGNKGVVLYVLGSFKNKGGNYDR